MYMYQDHPIRAQRVQSLTNNPTHTISATARKKKNNSQGSVLLDNKTVETV